MLRRLVLDEINGPKRKKRTFQHVPEGNTKLKPEYAQIVHTFSVTLCKCLVLIRDFAGQESPMALFCVFDQMDPWKG